MFSDNDNLKKTIKEEDTDTITGLGDYLEFIGVLTDDIFDIANGYIAPDVNDYLKFIKDGYKSKYFDEEDTD